MTEKKNANTPAAEVEQPSAAGSEPVPTEIPQEEKSADTAASEEPQQQSEASTDAETASSEQASNPIPDGIKQMVLVLCGQAEAMTVQEKVWKKMAADMAIIKRSIDEKTFPQIIDTLMADDDIPDTFVYVPAYCFPTHPVGLADLLAYRIRKKLLNGNTGAMEPVNDTGLPVLLHAKFVLQAQEKLGETYTEEEFFAAYNAIAHAGELPEEIGMTFGNTVAYVVKQPSCMARLAEVLVCKRFICTNAVGFPFIEARLKLLYGKR